MQITLKEKPLKSGKTSLYIEYYKGSAVNEKGKRVHLREVEYLKLYLYGNPETDIEKKENEKNLKLANNILTVRRSDYLQGRFNIQDRTKLKKPFLEYYKELAWEKRKSVKNYGVWIVGLPRRILHPYILKYIRNLQNPKMSVIRIVDCNVN